MLAILSIHHFDQQQPLTVLPGTISLRGVPFDSDFNTGLDLDLVCRLGLDSAVDSPLTVSREWSIGSDQLMFDGLRRNFSDADMVGTTPPIYQTVVSFRTLDARSGDSGNYTCRFNVEPVMSMFIIGTVTSISRVIVVEGGYE